MSLNGDRKMDAKENKRRVSGSAASTADWASCNADTLQRAICAVAITGGALRFGYSRDGGAYSLGIYGDGDPYTVWVPSGGELDIKLEEIIVAFEDVERRDTIVPRRKK